MKSIKNIWLNAGLSGLCCLGWMSCAKNAGDYKFENRTPVFAGSTYSYLQTQTGIYDSLLKVVDKLNLTDTLKSGKVTLFAVTNKSFKQVIDKLNISRKLRGKPPVYLDDLAMEVLDSMTSRYIIRGNYTADSLTQTDGRMLRAVRYAYPMNAKLNTANASGYKGGGPAIINFYNTKKSPFVKDWILATANAINIRTSNGVIHVLEDTHPFGFGEYTRPQPEPFDKSIFREPGYGGPFLFPSIVGEKLVIEAEDFDHGGEGVAYHDDLDHGKTNYRPADMVDIDGTFGSLGQIFTDAEGPYPASYSIGAAKAGEWLRYSVYVPLDGDFVITTRAGNGNTVTPLNFHIEFDFINVTGTLSFPNNGGWFNWKLIPSPSFHLSAGNHSMRFYNEANDIQLNNFSIKRVN